MVIIDLGLKLTIFIDTSPRPELGDTRINTAGFTPIHDMKNSPYTSNPETPISTATPLMHSLHSNTASHNKASGINPSQVSAPPAYTQRPDSPPLGNAAPQYESIASVTSNANANANSAPTSTPNRKAVISGVSGLSDREMGHMRQISDATVSSDTGSREGPDTPPAHNITFAATDQSPPLPVSPPSVAGVDGNQEPSDYVSVHGSPSSPAASASSPQRRSIFVESEDDLGKRGQEKKE